MREHLSNQELVELYVKTKDEVLVSEILERYDRMIRDCLKAYYGSSYYDDLYQEGRIALIKTIRCYDPTLAQFSTIAVHYINGLVMHFMRDRAATIRVPAWVQKHYRKEYAARIAFRAVHSREPEEAEIAQALNITVTRLRKIHLENPGVLLPVPIEIYAKEEDESFVMTPICLRASCDGYALTQGRLLDEEERAYLCNATVPELMSNHGVGVFDAQRIKAYVANL